MANVKLKRKIQYLQKNVEGSQPPSGKTLGHDGQKTSANALKRNDTSRPASHEDLSNAHMENNRQNQRTSRKEEESSTYIVGDSMINGMDERKMSNRRRIIKVRAHPGASISDMLDYLRPILRKKPTHLVLHAGTNDIRNLSPEEILDQFDKVNDVVTRDSPETKLILSSLIERYDYTELNDKINVTNDLLKKFCDSKLLTYVGNTNIDRDCINKSGLHLNHIGTIHLSRNFKQCLNSL